MFTSNRNVHAQRKADRSLFDSIATFYMMEPLTGAHKRQLKSKAQRLESTVRVGKNGLSDGFFKELNDALERSELVKVRFADFKDEKKELAPQIAEKSGSHFVTRVGNVAVYFRQQADPEKRVIKFSS